MGVMNVGKFIFFNMFLEFDYCIVKGFEVIDRVIIFFWLGIILNFLKFFICNLIFYRMFKRY